jgi:hypothetical protein
MLTGMIDLSQSFAREGYIDPTYLLLGPVKLGNAFLLLLGVVLIDIVLCFQDSFSSGNQILQGG